MTCHFLPIHSYSFRFYKDIFAPEGVPDQIVLNNVLNRKKVTISAVFMLISINRSNIRALVRSGHAR